jgi:hypothetical protein
MYLLDHTVSIPLFFLFSYVHVWSSMGVYLIWWISTDETWMLKYGFVYASVTTTHCRGRKLRKEWEIHICFLTFPIKIWCNLHLCRKCQKIYVDYFFLSQFFDIYYLPSSYSSPLINEIVDTFFSSVWALIAIAVTQIIIQFCYKID